LGVACVGSVGITGGRSTASGTGSGGGNVWLDHVTLLDDLGVFGIRRISRHVEHARAGEIAEALLVVQRRLDRGIRCGCVDELHGYKSALAVKGWIDSPGTSGSCQTATIDAL
jgi:hypothetical protein